ncbi:RagB/SusD family nutrient uptake outer membrane protein [Dyadobacter sp. CY323]|uniref:RagB/SusD family nutrient uptake outer membrane protein n=1 Tax=Dyadobacter sp. CY323 TaxID=2907302 RepID=UPI001F3402E4|nr:RagB/SusD family nutrient uptake outer membrane protein [Dyadobacter sp. CY323]MCE6991416.1 RagB/SusD family nutrient uptake outer membrane protein [Dyadobacter sp. CY323]
MKKIYLAVWAALLIAAASCENKDFLDTKTTASLNTETTFADSANTMDFLAGLYVDLAYNFQVENAHNVADFSELSDEGEGRYPALGNFDKIFTSGTFANGYYNQMQNNWVLFYRIIRSSNIFLANVDKSPLSPAKKQRVKAEARFVRAFHYFNLLKFFGGIPLVGDDVFSASDDGTFQRNTFEECVNYMTAELDAAAADMPLSYNGVDFGRITRGAALGLKSRLLLYAASPLYNGGGTTTNAELLPVLSYPTADPARWERARVAAKAVMDLALYSLPVNNTTKWSGSEAGLGYGFYNVFLTRKNPEFILTYLMPPGKQIERGILPRSRGGANFYTYPTQELVDKFPTINGKPITADVKSAANPTGFDAANPYVNRDPRLSATVIYNGGLYFLNTTKNLQPVYTYVGAPNDGIVAISSNTATITGYYVRKMADDNGAITGGNNVDRGIPLIRYAEILLNYAEAANETGDTKEAINTLKTIRIRAGIAPGTDQLYGLPAAPTKDQARALIQNERDIELAFEQHRIWDVRRWKLGPALDGKFLHGMQITKVGEGYTYRLRDVRTRYFKDIYYYFPIPKDDVVLNPKILQNPGY